MEAVSQFITSNIGPSEAIQKAVDYAYFPLLVMALRADADLVNIYVNTPVGRYVLSAAVLLVFNENDRNLFFKLLNFLPFCPMQNVQEINAGISAIGYLEERGIYLDQLTYSSSDQAMIVIMMDSAEKARQFNPHPKDVILFHAYKIFDQIPDKRICTCPGLAMTAIESINVFAFSRILKCGNSLSYVEINQLIKFSSISSLMSEFLAMAIRFGSPFDEEQKNYAESIVTNTNDLGRIKVASEIPKWQRVCNGGRNLGQSELLLAEAFGIDYTSSKDVICTNLASISKKREQNIQSDAREMLKARLKYSAPVTETVDVDNMPSKEFEVVPSIPVNGHMVRVDQAGSYARETIDLRTKTDLTPLQISLLNTYSQVRVNSGLVVAPLPVSEAARLLLKIGKADNSESLKIVEWASKASNVNIMGEAKKPTWPKVAQNIVQILYPETKIQGLTNMHMVFTVAWSLWEAYDKNKTDPSAVISSAYRLA